MDQNSIKGKNKDEIKVIEKRVASELDAFRTEKFMYFLFINALWIIISSIVLMYTGMCCFIVTINTATRIFLNIRSILIGFAFQKIFWSSKSRSLMVSRNVAIPMKKRTTLSWHMQTMEIIEIMNSKVLNIILII